MDILIDTANINHIKKAYDLYPIDGVTTNPTILSKETGNCISILREIRTIIGDGKQLHAQVLSVDTEGMIKEAEYLHNSISGNFYVKIPVTPQGIKAIKTLTSKGIPITATAVFTPLQALIAAKAGASYVAPYVNRIDNISGDGVKVVSEIVQILKLANLDTKVLAASFKNIDQVLKICLTGAQAATINTDIIDKMISHPLTDLSVENFIIDWEVSFGKGKLVTDF